MLQRIKIRTQLTVISAFVGSTFLTTMWIVYHQAQTVEFYRRENVYLEAELVLTSNLHTAIRNQVVEAYQCVVAEKKTSPQFEAITGSVYHHLNNLEKLDEEKLSRGNFKTHIYDEVSSAKLRRIYDALNTELAGSLALFKSGKTKEGRTKLLLATNTIFEVHLMPVIERRIQLEQAAYKEIGQKLKKNISLLKVIVIFLFGFSTLIVAYMMHHLLRVFAERLEVLDRATKQVKGGDLKARVLISGADELSELGQAFNQMISELEKAQSTLIEQQDKLIAQSKMSALGQMAAGIAHEINNPLAVIAADASKLQLDVQTKKVSDETLMRLSERVLNTTERIAKIIRGLRIFARDGGGDPFVESSAERILLETLEFCYTRFKNSGVALRVKEMTSDLSISCRPVQISQVLLNLLNNAFDAVVATKESWVSVELRDLGDSVEFIVTDSGSGIPKEVADRILEPFYTTKGPGKGTGMGLSISTGIVKAHGGEIYLNAKAENTQFVVRLPKHHSSNVKAA